MKRYTVVISKSASKYLSKLSGKIYNSISSKIASLEENPIPAGAVAIQGYTDTYRLRAGDYRIIYSIYENELVIDVIDIGHRGQVYNKY
jgi:mRNA interferase RelE/StbE